MDPLGTSTINVMDLLESIAPVAPDYPNSSCGPSTSLGSTSRGKMGRHEKLMEAAKGFRGRAKNCITVTRPRVEKGSLLDGYM